MAWVEADTLTLQHGSNHPTKQIPYNSDIYHQPYHFHLGLNTTHHHTTQATTSPLHKTNPPTTIILFL